MPKKRKSLILYQTMSGNTEKVAFRFKKVFEKKGWKCDIFKVDKNMDADNLPFDFQDYDFLCVGSGVYSSMPGQELMDITFKAGHQRIRAGKTVHVYSKITPGPKKGIVFVTYAGMHLGPKEAEPALSKLDLDIEHIRFKCVGRFSCPGKMGERATPQWWHGDIRDRPNERDLLKAEIFLEEKLEEPS
jgi:flavodoxin